MKLRCRVGDLAIVIDAYYRSNIGRIVKVLAPHDGQGDLVFNNAGHVWVVESPQPMTWTIDERRIRRKRGPVPDFYLKPIRGKPIAKRSRSAEASRQVHDEVEEQNVSA